MALAKRSTLYAENLKEKSEQNQKITFFLKSEWRECVNQIELLETMSRSKYEPKITQEEFNTRASHYLDQKTVLERICLRAIGKDIKDIS